MQFRCSKCGVEHDAAELEPTFDAPTAYWQVPPEEREGRTFLNQEKCGVRDLAETAPRYFLRVLMPVPVRGEDVPCCWGVWAEVHPDVLKRIDNLWDDPNQRDEPPLPAYLGNDIAEYPGSLGLAGALHLADPKTRPSFFVSAATGHPLAEAQRNGVYPETVIQWIMARAH